MDDIAHEFFLGVDMVAAGIFKRYFRADEGFSQEMKRFFFFAREIDGEGDAVSRGGVVKKFFMNLADLLFADKMKNDLLREDFEVFK